MVVQYATV